VCRYRDGTAREIQRAGSGERFGRMAFEVIKGTDLVGADGPSHTWGRSRRLITSLGVAVSTFSPRACGTSRGSM
jgi:hypothetical protein